jgi:DNA-binding beta-propeller fold protein YncE
MRFVACVGLILIIVLGIRTQTTAAAQRVVLVAGGAADAVKGDAKTPVAATTAKLDGPFAVDFNRDGTLFLVEMKGQRVLAVDKNGSLRTLAGNGEKGAAGDGGSLSKATFNGMHHLAVGPDDVIYIADTWNNRIRKIDAKLQSIEPFVGTGQKGFSGDGGPAAKAEFGGVYCLALTPSADKMYVADLDNRRIRRIDLKSGVVDTIAGNGERGVPKDGAEAAQSPLVDPRAVTADGKGNVYILERNGNALRVVDAKGRIRTLVGPGVTSCKDEQGKTPAPMKGPKHLCMDLDGNVLIADTENHLIRKYLPGENKLVRVAGTGKPGAKGLDGPPLEVELNQPHGVFAHPSGEIYISDSTNNRVLKIMP